MTTSNYSYNVVINRFKAFAEGHFQIRRFSHGQIDLADMPNDGQYPYMHVVPADIISINGGLQYAFNVIFADLPRDKELKPEYQREALSDCMRLAVDLLAEIKNGNVLFDETVNILDGASITPFIEEQKNTLTGVNLSFTLEVPFDWSACDIPADYAVGGSSSSGSGSGGGGILLQVDGVDNVVQSLLNLVAGDGITITDNGDGSVTFTSEGGGGGLNCTTLRACQTIIDLEADVAALQTSVAGKLNKNTAITAGTKTKITYDVKGLVTAGADATTADIADSTNKRYVTDAQLTVIGNTSGTNTGDQDLSGLVPKNAPITGATKTKITYDANGLVTSGADATTADISDSTNKRYVTDANLTVIGNTSGSNTGDETGATIRTKLGTTTVGAAVNTLTNPSAITYLKINADNSVTARTAAEMRADLGIVDTVSFYAAQVGTTVAGSTTTYALAITGSTFSGTEGNRTAVIPFPGTLKSFYFMTQSAQPAGGALVATFRKATGLGAFSDQTVTVSVAASAAAGIFSDTSNSFTVAAGDRITMKLANGSGSTSAGIAGWGFIIERAQ